MSKLISTIISRFFIIIFSLLISIITFIIYFALIGGNLAKSDNNIILFLNGLIAFFIMPMLAFIFSYKYFVKHKEKSLIKKQENAILKAKEQALENERLREQEIAFKNKENELKEADVLYCQKCLSTKIDHNKKGFSGIKSVGGAILLGPLGLLGGLHGNNKIVFTCLNCANTWKLESK